MEDLSFPLLFTLYNYGFQINKINIFKILKFVKIGIKTKKLLERIVIGGAFSKRRYLRLKSLQFDRQILQIKI